MESSVNKLRLISGAAILAAALVAPASAMSQKDVSFRYKHDLSVEENYSNITSLAQAECEHRTARKTAYPRTWRVKECKHRLVGSAVAKFKMEKLSEFHRSDAGKQLIQRTSTKSLINNEK